MNRAPEVHNVRQRRQRKTAAVVGHRIHGDPGENGWTNRNGVWETNLSSYVGPENNVGLLDGAPGPFCGKRTIWWECRPASNPDDRIVFHQSPLTPSFQALNLPFLQILPTIAFLSRVSSPGLITWIPQTVYITSKHIRFYFLVFFWFTLFSCCFRAV